MAKITVLGAGAMSSAFSVPCVDNNHETIIVGTHLDNQFIDIINKNNNFNPSLKLNLSKKTKFIKYNQLSNEKNNSPDLIVIGTNSKGIDWSVEQLKNFFLKKKITSNSDAD